jgi:hypothetical protein
VPGCCSDERNSTDDIDAYGTDDDADEPGNAAGESFHAAVADTSGWRADGIRDSACADDLG